MYQLYDPERDVSATSGKLERPWFVLLLGILVPVGAVVYLATSDGSLLGSSQMYWLAAFAGFPALLSALYVFLGVRYSVAMARRIVGTIGSIIALAGVAILIWYLKKYAL